MRYAPTDFVFIHWNNNDDTTAYNESFLPEKLSFFGLSFLSFALTLSRENRKDMIRINKLKAFIATTLLCSIALSACSSEDKTTTDVITTEDGVI